MSKKIQILSLLFLAATTLSAHALDFMQALELAEKSDPEILAAEFEYQSILETRAQSQSTLLPTIELSVFASSSDQERTNAAVNGEFEVDRDGYSLSLTQSIYKHGLYKQLEQTDINIALSTAEINAQRQTLILRVAEAYYAVLAAQDNLRFAKAEKKAIAQQLEQTQKRFDVGLIAITDVKESQAQYDVSLAQEIDAQNQLAISLETLRSLIGVMPNDLAKLSGRMALYIPEPENIDEWVTTAKQNNLTLKAAQHAYQLAKKQIDIDTAEHYPSLGLTVTHEDVSSTGGVSPADTKDTTVALSLTVPIYSGGLTSAKKRESIFKAEQARAEMDKAHRQTVKDARQGYLGLTTSIAQVKAFKQSLISTQAAHEATQAGFDVGTRTAVDVLASLREQYRAERDYAQSRYNYILNLIKLKLAAGILDKKDAQKINQWLAH